MEHASQNHTEQHLTREPTQAECNNAVSVVRGGLFPGTATTMTQGSWGHIPTGCSIDPDNGIAHWNTHPDGDRQFPLMCRKADSSWYATMNAKRGECDAKFEQQTMEMLVKLSKAFERKHAKVV